MTSKEKIVVLSKKKNVATYHMHSK